MGKNLTNFTFSLNKKLNKEKYLITGFEIHFCNTRRLTGGDLYKCFGKPLNTDGTAVGFNNLLVAPGRI